MIKAYHLLCEYEENPVGVATGKPAFSWRMEGDCDPVFQSAFQIVAAIDGAFACGIRDSGWAGSRSTLFMTAACRLSRR